MDMYAANSNLSLWEQAIREIENGTEVTDLRTDLFAALYEKSVATYALQTGLDPLEVIHSFVEEFIRTPEPELVNQ